jgi:hypothetical protein
MLATETNAPKIKQLAPFHEVTGAEQPIARLRMIKSQAEIELISKATDATVAAHLVAWKSMKAGLYEYQIAAANDQRVLPAWVRTQFSYAPIVGSGPNSTVLHYSANKRRMDSGEVGGDGRGVGVFRLRDRCDAHGTGEREVSRRGSARFTRSCWGRRKQRIAAIKPGMRMSAAGTRR